MDEIMESTQEYVVSRVPVIENKESGGHRYPGAAEVSHGVPTRAAS